MGGRNSFASGNIVPYTYKNVGKIHGVKVLVGISSRYHGLPVEAHSGQAYIKLKPDGTFHEMRVYDEDHYLVKEFAYHPEPRINNGDRKQNILHVHNYERDNFASRTTSRITKAEYEQYRKFFVGVPENDKW